ncbi:hypothetical protein LY78DRAFT_277177 [Colletotrichum sublineola]|nr:hypothetical protein LY78DRAFT_277177 [Colletotrichum sublineola]
MNSGTLRLVGRYMAIFAGVGGRFVSLGVSVCVCWLKAVYETADKTPAELYLFNPLGSLAPHIEANVPFPRGFRCKIKLIVGIANKHKN